MIDKSNNFIAIRLEKNMGPSYKVGLKATAFIA